MTIPFSLILLACTATVGFADTWLFDPQPDDFRADAILDLRSMNEKVAGESGFVKNDGTGNFAKGDGTPLRFWAVGTGVLEEPWVPRPQWPREKQKPDLKKHARFLAKRGVNLVRMHTSLEPDMKRNPSAKLEEVDEYTVNYIQECVAACKAEGIYTMVTPYWAARNKAAASLGLDTDDWHGLLFFDARVQAAYKGWLKACFTRVNPHTGIPLAKDPALAIIQIQNEDALHFWTTQALQEKPKAMLTSQFLAWADKKYGTRAALQEKWGGAQAKLELQPMWMLTQDKVPGNPQHLADQLEFFSVLMHDFHTEIVNFLRKDCGCQQLVSAGNWHTANAVRLDDALRYTYTATDVQGVNRYYPGHHEGLNSFWSIRPGNTYTSRSMLGNPLDWTLQLKQPVGQPFITTEMSWTYPSKTASEGPLLVAAYQGLTGIDAQCWFTFGMEQWDAPQSANGYDAPTQYKFLTSYPDCLGQFPAAAVLFRNGYVKQGPPVVQECRSLPDIWQRRHPVASEDGSYDSRKSPPGPLAPVASVDPLAFLVGPVEVAYGKPSSETKVADLTPHVNAAAGTVASNTGEHLLNTKERWFTLNTPCAQSVVAFFDQKKRHELPALTVEAAVSYGVLAAVSLDGKPLQESSKILVQAGTQSLPQGWKERPYQAPANPAPAEGKKKAPAIPTDALEIESVGGKVWEVTTAKFQVTVKNTKLTKATAVDLNGYAKGPVDLVKQDGVQFAFPTGVLYVVLE
jgi:hypothetical protein